MTSSELKEPPGSASSSSDVCECHHPRVNHHWHGAKGEACTGNRNLCGCRLFRAKPPAACICGCAKGAHMGRPEGCTEHGPHEFEPDAPGGALPPPEGPEYMPCVCGHIVPEHSETEPLHCLMCDCPAYRTKPDFEIPPQPEGRPPIAVRYSVQGHLYEVALSGDAMVTEVDGALLIQHALGPVSGIVQVLPAPKETSSE